MMSNVVVSMASSFDAWNYKLSWPNSAPTEALTRNTLSSAMPMSCGRQSPISTRLT